MRHDGGATELAEVEVVATSPKGSFAENLPGDDAARIYVGLHSDQRIDRVGTLLHSASAPKGGQ